MTRIARGTGRVLQRQAIRVNGWNKDRRTCFLTTLAATSNAGMAAQAAGMNLSGAYSLRQRDPAFAALWEAALEEGYRLLEGEVLAAARGHRVDPENPSLEELAVAERPAPAIDPVLAMKMLQLRQARAKQGMPANARFVRMTQEQVDDELLKLIRKLAAARARAAAETGNGQS